MNCPLTGKTLLVTRPSGQEKGLIQQLADLGAMTLHWPAIEIQPPTVWTPFDAALKNVERFDWIVFTSANGVRMCFERIRQLELPISVLDLVRTAAIGPATARALRRQHQSPKLIPSEYDSTALVHALAPEAAGQRILLINAEQSDPKLRNELALIATVHVVAAYQQVDTLDVPSDIRSLLASGDVDVVMFTSANIARSIINKLEPPALLHVQQGRLRIVTNSAATTQAVVELGLPVAAQAEASLDDGMVAAVMSICASVKEDL